MATRTGSDRTRRGHGEGGLYYDQAHSRWEATVEAGVDPVTGKRQRFKVRARTKTEALAKMREAREKVERQVKPGAGTITVGAFLDSWFKTVVDGRVDSDNTRTNYDQIIRLHLKPTLGSIRLDKLTADDVDRFLMLKADAGLSRSYVGRMRTVLADALRHAERRGLVIRNAAVLSVMPKAKPPTRRRSLTAEEARAILHAAEGERLEALVIVGLNVGLRPGELCGLRWGDLDLDGDEPTITVAGSMKWSAQVGGGYETSIGAVKKSSAGRRTVAILPVTVEALRAHKRRQAAERLKAETWGDQDLVFCSAVGTPLDPPNIRRTFARIAKRAGIDDFFPYMLRHTAASLAIDSGAGIEEVADMLGDDARTLLRFYRHTVQPVATAGLAMQDVLASGD